MKLPRRREILFDLSIQNLLGAVVAGFGILIASPLALAADWTPDNDLFESTNLLRISIEIPEEGLQALRGSRTARSPQTKPKAQAKVSEGGRVYTNVTVQLKGYTSFQPVDRFPGLTLNFNKLAPGQKFHGLAKLSLNNSLQDATLLHEKFSRELFAAASVPVPRADYALVTLNGRELGLYVVTEGFDKEFLKRHFKRTDGNLYEAGVLQDIDRPLQVDSGRNPTNHAGLQRLLRAAREPDPGRRFQVIEAALDMDRFLSMVAIETILCHSDSYSMNRNNYRLYHDPTSDKIVFMPHGMDRVLGAHRSTLDLSLVPPPLGLVARAVLSTPEGRRRYVERAGILFTNVFNPDRLCRRAHEIDAGILAAKMSLPADRRFSERAAESHTRDAGNLCDRISARAAELTAQLAHVSELLAPPPHPDFDTDGVARLSRWNPTRRASQSQVSCETLVQDEKPVLCLRVPKGPLTVSVHKRVSLPAGSYQVTGQIKATGGSTVSISAALVRHSFERFGVQRQRLDWKQMDFMFDVPESRSPDEIEFVCDVQSDAPQITFDASSLRLIRRPR